jgi:fluoride exporter
LLDAVESVLVAGFAGSLTTFSTWVVDAVAAPRAGRELRIVALLDLTGQLVAGVVIVVAISQAV